MPTSSLDHPAAPLFSGDVMWACPAAYPTAAARVMAEMDFMVFVICAWREREKERERERCLEKGS